MVIGDRVWIIKACVREDFVGDYMTGIVRELVPWVKNGWLDTWSMHIVFGVLPYVCLGLWLTVFVTVIASSLEFGLMSSWRAWLFRVGYIVLR